MGVKSPKWPKNIKQLIKFLLKWSYSSRKYSHNLLFVYFSIFFVKIIQKQPVIAKFSPNLQKPRPASQQRWPSRLGCSRRRCPKTRSGRPNCRRPRTRAACASRGTPRGCWNCFCRKCGSSCRTTPRRTPVRWASSKRTFCFWFLRFLGRFVVFLVKITTVSDFYCFKLKNRDEYLNFCFYKNMQFFCLCLHFCKNRNFF